MAFGQPSRGSATRRPTVQIVTPLPHVPDPPSPRYQHSQARRVLDIDVVDRSPDDYRPSTPRILIPHRSPLSTRSASPVSSIGATVGNNYSHRQYYSNRQLVHQPRPSYYEEEYNNRQLALIPSNEGRSNEIVRSHSSGAYVIERVPTPTRGKSLKKTITEPRVVERKQTLMLRDEKGNWTKVRRVIKS